MSKVYDFQDELSDLNNDQDTESMLEKLIEEFFRDQWKLSNPQYK
jgi:hypothetical protein